MQKLFSLFLISLFIFSPSVYSQDLPAKKKRSAISIKQSGSRTFFMVEGEFNYPNETALVLGIRYKESDEYLKWYRIQLKSKKFSTKLGPFTRPLLPGTYIMEVWFKLTEQPPHLEEVLRTKLKLPAYYSHKLEEVEALLGTKEERKKAFKEVGQQYMNYLKEINNVYKKTNKKFNWEDVKKRGTPPSLEDWKAFQKENLAAFREVMFQMRKWHKSYESLIKAHWKDLLKNICVEIIKLAQGYEKIYSIEAVTDPQQKKNLIKEFDFHSKGVRLAIEVQLKNLETKIDRLINPKKVKTGEEGVE